jgi:primosomal protein N' (replication factor Y)
MPLLKWFCAAYVCGFGAAMKTLLPDGFLKGEFIKRADDLFISHNLISDKTEFVYDPRDDLRFARFREILSDGVPSLISFPIYTDAEKFFEYLSSSHEFPAHLKEAMILYPRTGRGVWKTWRRLCSPEGNISVVVGGQNSAMAPIPGLGRIIVEDESSGAWRTMRNPIYSVRSLMASRARIEGASLVLGGRMPSCRAFMRMDAKASGHYAPTAPRVIFVDLKLAYSPSVEGVSGGLAVSEPLVRETEEAISRGKWAVWILDRKGYAGEIICEECGVPVRCPKCGGTMRLEASASRICCVSCGKTSRAPDECPNCAGRLLSARRPGLESLYPLADAAIISGVPILPHDADGERIKKTIRESNSGVMLGTRAALSLCDDAQVGMVGWLDADGEARSDSHDSRARAYSLIWESCWRGLSPAGRRVVLQTRRPGHDWQRGLPLPDGWRVFWRSELRERKELSMPPYTPLVKFEGRPGDSSALMERLRDAGCECWSPDDSPSTLWIRTKKLSELKRMFEPYFRIRRGRAGYPSVTVWHE